MSYSIVQSKVFPQTSDVTSWSATFDNPTVSGNMLVCIAQALDSGSDPMTGMAFDDAGTNTFSSVIEQNYAGGSSFIRLGMFYVPNCVGKPSHQITVTPTASAPGFSGQGTLTLIEVANVQVAPLDGTPLGNTGTVSPGSCGGITASAAGLHLAAMGYSDFSAETINQDAGWTNISNPSAIQGVSVMHRAAVGTVTQTPGWTLSATPFNGWAALHAVFKDSVIGGAIYVPIEMVS